MKQKVNKNKSKAKIMSLETAYNLKEKLMRDKLSKLPRDKSTGIKRRVGGQLRFRKRFWQRPTRNVNVETCIRRRNTGNLQRGMEDLVREVWTKLWRKYLWAEAMIICEKIERERNWNLTRENNQKEQLTDNRVPLEYCRGKVRNKKSVCLLIITSRCLQFHGNSG